MSSRAIEERRGNTSHAGLNHPGQHGTHAKIRLPRHYSYAIDISNVHLSHWSATRRCRHPFTGRWPRRQVGPTEDLAHPAPFRSDALLLSTRYARRLRSSPAAQRRASDRRHTRGQGSREECRGNLMTRVNTNQTWRGAMSLGTTCGPAICFDSKVRSCAGIPVLAAASCSLIAAVALAEDRGLTLVGFLRGQTMNVYAQQEPVRALACACRHDVLSQNIFRISSSNFADVGMTTHATDPRYQ